MEDVNARYGPSKVVAGSSILPLEEEYFPPGIDRSTVPGPSSREVQQHQQHLLESFERGDYAAMGVLRLLEEKELVDELEWRRLQMALLADKGRHDMVQ